MFEGLYRHLTHHHGPPPFQKAEREGVSPSLPLHDSHQHIDRHHASSHPPHPPRPPHHHRRPLSLRRARRLSLFRPVDLPSAVTDLHALRLHPDDRHRR